MKCMLRNQYFLYKTTLAVKPLVRRYLQQTCLLRIQAISVPTKNRCNNRWGIPGVYDWRPVTRNDFENVSARKSRDFCTGRQIGEAQLLNSTTCMLRNRVISVQNTNVEGGGDKMLVPRSGSYILMGGMGDVLVGLPRTTAK